MSKNTEKELEETKQKVKDLMLVLKQVLSLVSVSGRVDSKVLLEDIKLLIEDELK